MRLHALAESIVAGFGWWPLSEGVRFTMLTNRRLRCQFRADCGEIEELWWAGPK